MLPGITQAKAYMPNNHSDTDVVGPEILACFGGHGTDEDVIAGGHEHSRCVFCSPGAGCPPTLAANCFGRLTQILSPRAIHTVYRALTVGSNRSKMPTAKSRLDTNSIARCISTICTALDDAGRLGQPKRHPIPIPSIRNSPDTLPLVPLNRYGS